jgi:hypothetical protein
MKDTGGPAFPTKRRIQRAGYLTDEYEPCGGMSLRDYFAAKAMQGELASMRDLEGDVCGLALDISDETLNRLTRHYYRIADAMLKARQP